MRIIRNLCLITIFKEVCMKNLTKLLGIIALTAVIGFGVAGCESPTDPAHVHDYEWSVITPATCIATGEETGVCKLDPSHTTTREIAIDTVNGHDWDFDNATETKAPTCTTPGDGTIDCKRQGCGEERSGIGQIPIKSDAHDYQNYAQTTAPTCSAKGIDTGTCTYNNAHKDPREGADIDPDNHNYGNWITTAPTCTTTGIDTRTCSLNATHKETRNETAIDPNAHDWKNSYAVTTPATCSATGIETDTCSLNIAHTRTQTVAINPNAHNWNTETGLCNNNCGELYYNLGDTGPGGGKIFYRIATGFTMTDNNTTAHYLEAAPADTATGIAWASSAFISPDWGGTGDWADITGTDWVIGTGRKNTALILATDADAPAAKACNDYSNGGKTDWFLPSVRELEELYKNRTSVGNMGTDTYWSSSQGSNTGNACYHRFSDGNLNFNIKSYTFSVRAVRAF